MLHKNKIFAENALSFFEKPFLLVECLLTTFNFVTASFVTSVSIAVCSSIYFYIWKNETLIIREIKLYWGIINYFAFKYDLFD